MTPIVDRIIRTLGESTDAGAINDAMLDAAFLFEKARGLPPRAWGEDVLNSTIIPSQIQRLQEAVVEYVEWTHRGAWTLGKCNDMRLKPLLFRMLKHHVTNDAEELYQVMVALSNLGEPVFGPDGSTLVRNSARNRELARSFLARS